VKYLFFASLPILWLFAPCAADAEMEPLNNAAPFMTDDFNLRPETGRDHVTATAKPLPAFTTSGFVEAMFFPPHYEYDPNFGRELKDLITAR
jgi:hypothetical protein